MSTIDTFVQWMPARLSAVIESLGAGRSPAMTGRVEVALAAAGLGFCLAAVSGSAQTPMAELLLPNLKETVMSAPAPTNAASPSAAPESIRSFRFHAPDEA
ncbi:MAG TPA: hypothetical protein VIZ58_00810, partial [Thermoanaerobaculia bacterium]